MNTVSRLFFIAGIAFLMIHLFSCYKKSPFISFSWQSNAAKTYYVTIENFYQIPSQANTTKKFMAVQSLIFRGRLHMKVFSVDKDSILTGFQFSHLKIKQNRQRVNQLESILKEIVYVTFNKNGKIQRYNFHNSIAKADEKMIKNILNLFQIVLTEKSQWETLERDNYGLYKAHYINRKNIIKQKKQYQLFSPLYKKVRVIKSQVTAHIDKKSIWLDSLSGNELIKLTHRGVKNIKPKNNKKDILYSKYSKRFILQSKSYNSKTKLPLYDKTSNPIHDIALWEDSPKNTFSVSQKLKRIKLYKKYRKITLEKLVRKTFSYCKTHNWDCFNEIEDYFKAYPNSITKISSIIKNNTYNQFQNNMLISAVHSQKTMESQKVLIKIMNHEKLKSAARLQASQLLGHLNNPEKFTVEALKQRYHIRNEKNPLLRRLSNTSILAMGNIARKIRFSRKPSHIKMRNKIKSYIKSELHKKIHINKLCTLLSAAANTGDKQFIPILKKFLTHKLVVVRMSAVTALGYYFLPETEKILARVLEKDGAVNVRIAVSRMFYLRPLSDRSLKVLQKELRNETNTLVRSEMYRVMVKNRKRAGVRKTLKHMLKNEPDFKCRSKILNALSSQL